MTADGMRYKPPNLPVLTLAERAQIVLNFRDDRFSLMAWRATALSLAAAIIECDPRARSYPDLGGESGEGDEPDAGVT